MADVYERSLKLHEEHHGKLAVRSKVRVENKEDLSLAARSTKMRKRSTATPQKAIWSPS